MYSILWDCVITFELIGCDTYRIHEIEGNVEFEHELCDLLNIKKNEIIAMNIESISIQKAEFQLKVRNNHTGTL